MNTHVVPSALPARRALSLLLVSCCALLGCRDPLGSDMNYNCPDIARVSFAVSVQDSVSGAAIASGARLLWMQGHDHGWAFGQTCPGCDQAPLFGPEERPGHFRLRVFMPGYFTWTREIDVPPGPCGVQTVSLTARLQPR